MKLYYTPGACSMSPHIVATEAGIELELEKVDLKTKKTASGADFTTINSKGYVPALQLDDGSILTEGPAIVQFLADRAPGSKLAPAAGTMERYRLQEWLNFISTELHKGFSPLFNPAITPEQRTAVVDRLGMRFGWLDKQLAGKKFLTGDQFTVADAYLYTVMNWAGMMKIDLGQWAGIKDYMGRVGERRSVQKAMEEEGLVKKG